MSHSIRIALALSVVATSCTSPAEDVQLALERADVVSGQTMNVTVVNGSESEIQFGACPFELERRVRSQWVDVPTDAVCIDVLYILEPGGSRVMDFRVPPSAEPGIYRLLMGFTAQAAGRDEALSPAFSVRSAP